jgi:dihydropteroate synthase
MGHAISSNQISHELVKDRVLIMGIVNITPDSFSDGGLFEGSKEAIAHAARLQAEGADIVDIGGESTRPGADPVSVEQELARVIPVLEGLKGKLTAKISIDTRKAEVMRRALLAGADMINDVTALQYNEDSLNVAAGSSCPVILMHGKGDPKTMQDNPTYEDVVTEVHDYLQERIDVCEGAGISRARLVIDPGIGFGKTLAHNVELLANLDRFADLGVPLLLGASRKRFIGALSGEQDPLKRVPGSIAAALSGLSKGVRILRVHDVRQTRQALDVWQAIEGGES